MKNHFSNNVSLNDYYYIKVDKGKNIIFYNIDQGLGSTLKVKFRKEESNMVGDIRLVRCFYIIFLVGLIIRFQQSTKSWGRLGVESYYVLFLPKLKRSLST